MLSDELLDELAWVDDAACARAGLPYGAFFPEDGRPASPEVQKLCQGCPVRRQCIEHAKRWHLTQGWFGGISPGQRRRMTTEELLNL